MLKSFGRGVCFWSSVPLRAQYQRLPRILRRVLVISNYVSQRHWRRFCRSPFHICAVRHSALSSFQSVVHGCCHVHLRICFCVAGSAGGIDLFCWGSISSQGSQFSATSPTKICQFFRKHSAAAVSNALVCIVTVQGSVQCWGPNDSGQLGLGHTATPVNQNQNAAAAELSFVPTVQMV